MIAWVSAALAAPEVEGSVEARVVTTVPSAFPLDAAGTDWGWGPALDTRLRLGLSGSWEAVRAQVETDALSGQAAGATWALDPLDERGRHTRSAFALSGVQPRIGKVGARLPWFDLEVGLTTSRWGLGMLANDGAGTPTFGRTDFGDRSLRARLATQPFGRSTEDRDPVYAVVAADRVIADEQARMSEGDVVWQGLAALVLAPDGLTAEDPRILGVYGVWRDQTSADGHRTTAAVADLTGSWRFRSEAPIVHVGGEAALIAGRTELARTYADPSSAQVFSGGAVGLVAVSGGPLTGTVKGAWASGDRAPDDDRVTDFRFDRDYDVGMVLFDEVAAAVDLRAYTLVTDPERAAVPPAGAETLAAEGAFHAAAAVQPVVSWEPVAGLAVSFGAVAAWSTSPIAHAYYTFRAGGVPTNAADRPSVGRWLGSELDWSVSAHAPAEWRVRPELRVQGGHAFPSEAYLPGAGRVDHLLISAFGRY